jgi:two-component system chemotaxis response regulator CheB
MRKLRVLVVEDSLTVRKRLVEVIEQDPDFEVAAEAEDGKQAIECCLQHRPDVVTMDMMLPVLTGLGATEYIMAHCPTPILVVSSSFNRGEVFKTYDALAAGAVDVFEKPTGHELPGAWEREFLRALRIVCRVKVITHPRARLTQSLREAPESLAPRAHVYSGQGQPCAVLALGASTGGPRALARVIGALPKDFALPVVAVMHIGAAFAVSFAEWLDAQVDRKVSYARGGEALRSLTHQVLLAPPDRHLIVHGERLVLTQDAERHACRPSVDTLFESVAREHGPRAIGCLLTGMGRDGALGLLALRQTGATTIAQDEESSVVYGMPREAALLGAASRVLPLEQIGPAIALLGRALEKSEPA